MARVACFLIPTLLLAGVARSAPQDDPKLKTTLKPAELRSLNTKAKKWIAAELKWDEDSKHRKTRDRERSKFMEELGKKSKSKDVLASVGNCLAIFDMVFPYKKQSAFGAIKAFKQVPKHSFLAPKGYSDKKKYASVLVLPGWDDGKNAWVTAKNYIPAAYNLKTSLSVKNTFLVVPELRKGDDYETAPDLTKQQDSQSEGERIRGALGALGEVQRTFRLDRTKMFLDCGNGTSGFGFRLLTYFPSRFAGVIIRQPKAFDKLRLGSLTGLPVLLVSTDATKAACDAIKAALDKLQPDKDLVTIVKGDAANPYESVLGEVDKFIASKSRRLFPLEVTLAPNHDMFHKGYWAEMISCEALDSVAPGQEPLLTVKAVPEKNQIIVSTRNVSEIGLYLNDYLVDLDKEVTLVVNGVEIKGSKFQRNIATVEKYMRRAYDPTALYTAYYRLEIPKAAAKTDGGK